MLRCATATYVAQGVLVVQVLVGVVGLVAVPGVLLTVREAVALRASGVVIDDADEQVGKQRSDPFGSALSAPDTASELAAASVSKGRADGSAERT